MPKYLEGNTYVINGKKQIYQPDGTFRDASIVSPPKPVDYVDVPAPKVAEVPSTIPGQFNTEAGKKFAAGRPSTIDTPTTPVQSPVVTAQPSPLVTYKPDGTRILSADEQALSDYYNQNKPVTQEEIAAREEQIRQRNLTEQQNAISGINAMYTNILNQVNQENKSRAGSAATITALAGERGSASGAASEARVAKAGEDIVKATETERQAKIDAILTNSRRQTDAELAQERELRTTDANKWLEYKAGEVERSKARALDLRKSFIASSIKPEEIDDKTYEQIAQAGGYTLDQAKSLYKAEYDNAQKSFLETERKRLAEIEKTTLENTKTKAETKKIEADTAAKSEENLLLNKGYTYVSTPAERDALKKQGRTIIERNGKTYVGPVNKNTKVITRGNNNILIDTITGADIRNLGPAKTKVGGSGSNKNYTATTIPADIKKDLLYDKNNGGELDDLMNAYPEVSTSYIQSLFADPNRINY